MKINKAYKRADGTYVVDGYHVCPKSIDPHGRYDIAEVEAYLAKHPEALIDEPRPPEPTTEEIKARRVAEINARIKELDAQSISHIRAFQIGKQTADDIAKLEKIDIESKALNAELKA